MQREISKNVMRKNYDLWTVACDCGSNDCEPMISLEVDHEDGSMSVVFYKKMWTKHSGWHDNRIVAAIADYYVRMKVALKVLFMGYYEIEGDMILRDEDHINAMIQALEEAKVYGAKKKAEYTKRLEAKKESK